MFDVAGMSIQEFSRAIVAEHAHKAERARWRIELEDLERVERATAGKPRPPQNALPKQFTGAHSPWI